MRRKTKCIWARRENALPFANTSGTSQLYGLRAGDTMRANSIVNSPWKLIIDAVPVQVTCYMALGPLVSKLCKVIRSLIVSFVFIVVSNAATSATPTQCSDVVELDLQRLITEQFPTNRLPQLADLDQKSIGFDLADGGNGCYSVAVGDFDGDKRQDYAIWLKSTDGKSQRLIVAMRRNTSWKINQLPAFCDTFQFCYVKPEKPGVYVRSPALDTPPTRAGERSKLTSKTTSVLAGHLESTGIVYVRLKGRWYYVWVSD